MIRLIFLCALIILLCGNGCDEGASSANTPEEMFEALIMDPMPSSIKNLEGVGDTWQGYNIFLRFEADGEFIGRLSGEGYEKVEWDAVKSRFELPKGYDKFKTPWKLDEIKNKECFRSSGNVKNKWTHSGEHFFVIDRERSLVYFYGVGS